MRRSIFLIGLFVTRVHHASSSSSPHADLDPEHYKPCGIEDKVYAKAAILGGTNVDAHSPDPLRGVLVARDFCLNDGEYLARGLVRSESLVAKTSGGRTRMVVEGWCWVRVCDKDEIREKRTSEWEIWLD